MTATRGPKVGPSRDTAQLDVMLAIFDFPMLSASFRDVIAQQRDMRVVAESATREATVEEARAADPDVILLECDTFVGDACRTADAIDALRAACPEARIIALDCRCATDQFSVALKAGANGFLTREAVGTDVVAAVRSVVAGHTYVSPSIVTRMVDTYVRRSPEAGSEDPYDLLTEREREILLLAAMGHTNREIARSMRLSEQTVHHNRAAMMEKLGLHDRVDLLRYTVRRGLINPSTL